MNLSISTALANQLLGGNDLASTLSGGKMYVYAGAVPANADAAAAGATLLATVTESGDGGTGLTFATPAAGGVLQKTAAEEWKCLAANITDGTAAFYRFCAGSDDGSGAASSGNYRLQGTIGTDMSYDLIVPGTELSTSADFGPVTSFGVQLPLA